MIDLLLVGEQAAPVTWSGTVVGVATTPTELARLIEQWGRSTHVDGLLCWDLQLGPPPAALVEQLISGRGDIWHAGLRLGTAGHPGLIDFVMPTWMLNRDPQPDREASSWRASPHACLVRADVVRQLGGPRADFDTPSGAFLEWGLRAIHLGAMVRHVPSLVRDTSRGRTASPTLADEIRIIASRYTPFWTRWAVFRGSVTGYAPAAHLARAYAEVGDTSARRTTPYRSPASVEAVDLAPRITVLIPTLDRYPYLRVVLENLRAQSVVPAEIILVDQTSPERRELELARDFADLPLTILYRDEPGQSGARNEGLARAMGDYVLFLDDDVEFGPSLIESHLRNLARFGADVSSGSVYEPGTSPPDPASTYPHISEVFPTGNTLVKRDVLVRSGLFDLAFDRAPRADGELGMRVYLSGALMVFDAGITMLHHRAPSGGLRNHGARVVTYRTSREQLTHRHIPHISEIYLASRHFTPRQVREVLWLRTLGTLSGRGSVSRRIAKLLVGAALLPDTIRKTVQRRNEASSWMTRFPQIAQLDARVTSRPTR